MQLSRVAPLVIASALFSAVSAEAAAVGTYLTDVKLEGFAQTKAKSFDDLAGRAVLIEFFAFW